MTFSTMTSPQLQSLPHNHHRNESQPGPETEVLLRSEAKASVLAVVEVGAEGECQESPRIDLPIGKIRLRLRKKHHANKL